jgi:hypothetical protein
MQGEPYRAASKDKLRICAAAPGLVANGSLSESSPTRAQRSTDSHRVARRARTLKQKRYRRGQSSASQFGAGPPFLVAELADNAQPIWHCRWLRRAVVDLGKESAVFELIDSKP